MASRLDSITTTYDASGNQAQTVERPMQRLATGSGYEYDSQAMFHTRSYYGADERLRTFERLLGRGIPVPEDTTDTTGVYFSASPGGGDPMARSAIEEYRYDALGRRVLTRLRREESAVACVDQEACVQPVTRTIWDGDQVLWELRAAPTNPEAVSTTAPALGRVMYMHGDGHGGGIDQPLAFWKEETGTLIPHASWRGLVESGTFVDGQSADGLIWPGRSQDAYFAPDTRLVTPAPTVWLGNLVTGKTDASGQQYMRNRYYDPRKGRFTQEDPIGLAGGLNLYGYANGDPVNYSDPFGLCPSCVVWVLRAIPYAAAGGKLAAEVVDPNPGAGIGGSGKIVIGETMSRVRAFAGEAGAETFETAAKTAKGMWKENSTWLRKAIRDGKEVLDIGEDPARAIRSKFYQAEKEIIERRAVPITKEVQP